MLQQALSLVCQKLSLKIFLSFICFLLITTTALAMAYKCIPCKENHYCMDGIRYDCPIEKPVTIGGSKDSENDCMTCLDREGEAKPVYADYMGKYGDCVSCVEADLAKPIWNGKECISCSSVNSSKSCWNGTECVACPYAYQIEYLESSGTQYIDTGIIPTSESKIDITIMSVSNTGSWRWVIGAGNRPGLGKQSLFGFALSSNKFYDEISGYNRTTLNFLENEIYNVKFTEDNINVNGSNASLGDNSLKESTYTIRVFALNNAGSNYDQNFYGRVYDLKLYDSDTLTGDYIPVVDYNGEPCMYDKVSGQLFYNKGSGEFIAGPKISDSE